MNNKKWYVYIMSNKRNWTLYVWVTSNLEQRTLQHKNKRFWWFTAKYDTDKLMRFQEFSSITEAIEREKKLKWWNRKQKIKLIEDSNPNWEDLAP